MSKILKYLFIFLAVVFVLLIIAFCFFFVGEAPVRDNIKWGVDFSQMQAESLGLNWEETYLALIDDLGAKYIKIHTQWDWVEGKDGEFYFDDIDWQLQQAKDNGVEIIYVVGAKSGRWPECHIPDWASSLSEQQQKDAALDYIKETVQRYKDNDEIAYWQVENEPLFPFGECPSWYYEDNNFLKREVGLVKSLDTSRKVIVSDTGENSLWFNVAKVGDIVGTTMYRNAWVHITDGIGFHLHYFFPPVYYSRKAFLVQKLFDKDVICIEFQAEPWASTPFNEVSLSEQAKTMNLEIFKDNIEYAKQTGFDTFYFWGTEWWYWMKTENNQPTIWNEAKNLFAGQ